MARTTGTVARHRSKKRLMKRASGFRAVGGRFRLARERVLKADANAYIGRKLRKRDFRSLWITRVSAAAEQNGLRYSQLICGLKRAGIELNRKMLSEIAIHDPAAFTLIAEKAKAALPAELKPAAA